MDAHLNTLLPSGFVRSILFYYALPQFKMRDFSFSFLPTICCKRQTTPCSSQEQAQSVGVFMISGYSFVGVANYPREHVHVSGQDHQASDP